MAYTPRVTIPALEGPYTREICAGSFQRQEIEAGTNAISAVLLTITWSALLADSPIDPFKPRRTYRCFIDGLLEDYRGSILKLSSLWGDIVSQVTNPGPDALLSDETFEEARRTPIFREILHFARTGCTSTFRFITTFLLYGKKVIFEDESLDAISLRDWLEVEDRLRDVAADTIGGLYSVVRWALSNFKPDYFLPKHGGGSVAEGTRSVVEKCRLIQPDSVLDYVLERSYLSTASDFSAYPWLMGNASKDPNLLRRAKLIFVPKDINKTRSINMEPAMLQWAQQGVRLWLEKAIETGPLGAYIVLSDQTENRAFAQYGSLTGRVDTIDLSSASDSVRLKVIRANFQPGVLKYLLATRSTTVELPDKSVFEPLKYAPMGSALCFPVQCILYTCIMIVAGIQWRLGGEALTDDLSNSEVERLVQLSFADTLTRGSDYKLEPLRVFGDDLICDHRITDLVISHLKTLGFLVNIDKSFRGDSAFRESCGGYYMYGHDVSPVRFKGVRVDDDELTCTDSLVGLVDHANDLFWAGLMHARRHVVQYILYGNHKGYRKNKSGVNQILFSSDPDDAQSIFHRQPSNSHLRLRMWDGVTVCDKPVTHANSHIAYQRMEVRSAMLGSRLHESQSYKDDYLWGLWWRGKYGDNEVPSSIGEPISRADTTKMVVRWRWTPIG